MNVKKILSRVASTIKLFIIILLSISNSNSNSKAEETNIKYYSDDSGILSLMYHRFNEDRYPSTNIQMDVFKQQIEIIKKFKYSFYDPKNLDENFHTPKVEKKIGLYPSIFLKIEDEISISRIKSSLFRSTK